MENNASKPQEPTLAEYNIDLSIYQNYKEKLSRFNEELVNLEDKKKLLEVPYALSYFIAFFLTFLLFNFYSFGDFWENLIASIFVALYPALFFEYLFAIDFLINIFSFGKLNKLKKLFEDTKEQIEELKTDTQNKVQPFEKAASEYYQSQLRKFFENNLYKKRSGTQEFEEDLLEFASMIEELSTMSSVFITNTISSWGLWEYKEYLNKRTVNHNIQTSKKSEGLNSVRNFVKNFSKTKAEEQKEIISPEKLYRTARKIDNWEEINRKRKITGQRGEEVAVVIEQEFLESIGRKDLSEKVQHVSVEQGDGLGYDVLSFFEDGKDKYIEVKSTTTSLLSPFYLSRNELEFLKEHNEDYSLYRILFSNSNDDIPQLKTYSSNEVLEMNEIIPVQYIVQGK